MTPSDTSALPFGRPPRSAAPRASRGDNAAFVAERLAARRQRVRTIRKWVVTSAVTLFLAVMIMIVAQSHLVSTSTASSPTASTSDSSSSASSSTGLTSSTSGGSSSSGSASPVTSSQS